LSDAEASERTEFYIMYDRDMLYVGVRLWDSLPDEITANTLRQGERLDNDDRVAVILDTFNDKRNGYRFEVNPNGIRDDALYLDGAQLQWEWEGIYSAEAAGRRGWRPRWPFSGTLSLTGRTTRGYQFPASLPARTNAICWVFRNRNQLRAAPGRDRPFDMNQGLG
jgi:hypothetical protein